jgi:hypothetical protein
VVKADLDDVASVQNAVKDAYGVFLVTNFWEGMDAGKEIKQVKDLTSPQTVIACWSAYLVYSLRNQTDYISQLIVHV